MSDTKNDDQLKEEIGEDKLDNISQGTALLAEFAPEEDLVGTSLEPFQKEDDKMVTTETVAETATSEEPSAMVKSTSDDGIFAIMYSTCKKAAIVGSIYLVGYMGWSVAWLIAPLIISVARNHYAKSTAHKRNIAKASAIASEKEVILARIDDLPAWVYFPDVERAEWLNKILKQLWPNANHYARTLVKETIEPSISESLAFYKVNGFRFDRIILGTIPPRIGGVKVYDRNVARNEIIMDLDLFYASDCDINFYLGSVKGGIKDFQIHGWVRVIMKPLIRTMPLVGGLQIFFLNNPNIDFNLVGVIDFMDMPGLSDLLRRVIVEQIGNIMVLPNKLPISLSDDVPAIDLKMPEPEGILRIHVVEAKHLMKKDIGVLGKGKSDPYTIINVGAQEFRTQTIDNNVNPKWDYWCEATVFVDSGQDLEFRVMDFDEAQHDEFLGRKAVVEVTQHTTINFCLFDWDRTGDDESLGRATIEIIQAVKRGTVDTWLTLEEAKHGLLHVRLQWYGLSTDPGDLAAALLETQLLRVTSMSTALLTVFIDSAKHLKSARTNTRPDPYVVCSVGKQKNQTAMIMRDDSPVWEQGFTFLVANPENDTLQIHIYDQKTNNEIGKFTYVIASLLTKKNMEVVSQPFQLYKSGPESKIIMSMSLRILKKAEESVEEASGNVDLRRSTSQLSRSSVNRPHSASASDRQITSTAKDLQSQISSTSSTSTPGRSGGIVGGDEVKMQQSALSSTPPLPSSFNNLPKPFEAALASGPASAPSEESVLKHRFSSMAPSAGEFGLGRIQLSTRYVVARQKLYVTIHKIMNIPCRDPSNIPDPYVKLYLLPGRSKDSKRKTVVIKDNCNPVYDASFEYLISMAELLQSELEVTVCTQKGFLATSGPVIGMLKIYLNEPEISDEGLSMIWYDLEPDSKHD